MTRDSEERLREIAELLRQQKEQMEALSFIFEDLCIEAPWRARGRLRRVRCSAELTSDQLREYVDGLDTEELDTEELDTEEEE